MNLSTVFTPLLTDAISPSEEEKEHNIQYHLVCTLNDKELVKKLLALALTTTTAKMLEVWRTHITISDNLEAMGLKEQKIVHARRKQNKPQQGKKTSNIQCALMWTLHKVPPHLAQSSCSVQDDICHRCGKKGQWKPKC